MSIREYSRKTETQPTKQKNTNTHKIPGHLTPRIKELHDDLNKSHRETHTHTPEAYDDFKHGISKAKENKNNLQSYD